MRAISEGDGDGIRDRLFALNTAEESSPAIDARAREIDADGFAGLDLQFPFVYTRGTIVYDCAEGVCAVEADGASEAPVTLAEASCLAPSKTPGRVWLARLDPDQPQRLYAIGSAHEVDVTTGEIHARIEVPARRLSCPVGSFAGGLLFQDPRNDGLLAASAGDDSGFIGDLFPAASHGTLVATYDTRPRRYLRLTNLDGGETRRLPAPRGFRFEPSDAGAFSPDGSTIAALVKPIVGGSDRGFQTVALIDLDGGPPSILGGRVTSSLAFSPDGQTLYFVGGPARRTPTSITAFDLTSSRNTPYVTKTALGRILHIDAGP